jgi:uncharacterized membrane protein
MELSAAMSLLDFVTLLCALGTGLMAGFFFAFSICVMKALGKLPPAHAIAAMQSINVVVINAWFLSVFFGTALVCVWVMIAAFSRWHDPRATYWLAGAVFYLVGTIGVTMLFNVPRNNALAVLVPADAQAATFWSGYLSSWTAWNHVRTIAALAAAVLFAIAFRLRA